MKTGKTYIWAAAHNILPEQRAELEQNGGEVVLLSELVPELHKDLCNLTPESDLRGLAIALISVCNRHGAILVQPAGSPAFQNVLGQCNQFALEHNNGRVPIAYAISERVSEDIPQEDGTIKKVSVFRHLGFQYV